MPNTSLEQVRDYWESHPLYTHEIPTEESRGSFFVEVDRIKREDVERFSMKYWQFEGFKGKKVLDIGCGPGWLSVQYARAGAHVTSVDLTDRAVELTRQHFELHGMKGDIRQANAEHLPFDDESFDLVCSSGVLHHTPDTEKAISEACRVTRKDGEAKITLYHKGLLHSRFFFPFITWGMRRMKVKHPGADLAHGSSNVDDFIRRYDGDANPIGRGYSTRETRELFSRCGYTMLDSELHFFPIRFVPMRLAKCKPIHFLLDRWFGTMIYARLRRAKCDR